MCLTSVFGMVTSPSAAGGGCSEGAVRAAVGSCERRSVADKDAGHRNRSRACPPPVAESRASAVRAGGGGQRRRSRQGVHRYPNRKQVDCPHVPVNKKQKPHYGRSEVSVFALPIFLGSRPPSIVGADVLNFCVRDGNRWTHIAINTNYLVTHTGFEPMLTA